MKCELKKKTQMKWKCILLMSLVMTLIVLPSVSYACSEFTIQRPYNDTTYSNWNGIGYDLWYNGSFARESCSYMMTGDPHWTVFNCNKDTGKIWEDFDGNYTLTFNISNSTHSCTDSVEIELRDSPSAGDRMEWLKVIIGFTLMGLILTWYLFKNQRFLGAMLMMAIAMVVSWAYDSVITMIIAFIIFIHLIYVMLSSIAGVTGN